VERSLLITATEDASVLTSIENGRYLRRKVFNAFMTGLITSLAVVSVATLALILVAIFINGASGITLDLFIKDAIHGGIGHAIVGTLEILLVAGLIAIPLGIATSIYLSEYGHGWLGEILHLVLDLLAQMPSIVIGLFVWALLIQTGVFRRSGITGSIALAIIMLPIIARSVEEILRLVPDHLREAALALGTPRWRVTLGVVIPTVLPGIVTGVILAMARAAGETAPLLLTTLGNSFFQFDMLKAVPAVPLQLYQDVTFASGPEQLTRAWAAALVLIVMIAGISVAVRLATGRIQYES